MHCLINCDDKKMNLYVTLSSHRRGRCNRISRGWASAAITINSAIPRFSVFVAATVIVQWWKHLILNKSTWKHLWISSGNKEKKLFRKGNFYSHLWVSENYRKLIFPTVVARSLNPIFTKNHVSHMWQLCTRNCSLDGCI